MSDEPGYHSRVNTDILKLIQPDAETILEIGCGDGSLYTAYRRVNPFCVWYAVEKDTESRIAAYKAGVKIIGDDAEVSFADDVEPWREDVDCLVIGDALEHFREPLTVLENSARCVKPSGIVVASIPNVQNYSLIVSLLQGRWDYKDEGLLDRGHLRWFTLHSIREMFAEAGLQIFDVRGRCFGNEHHPAFMERAKAFGGWHGIDLATLDKQSRVLQFVVRAIKPIAPQTKGTSISDWIAPQKIHIHCLTTEPCCSRPRIIEPAIMLETIPGVTVRYRPMDDKTILAWRPQYAEYGQKILIEQRRRSLDIKTRQGQLDFGWLVVAEIDDDPEALQGVSDNDFMVLRSVHAVQCSTERIAESCRRWNPNVQVFQNMIAELPPQREYRDHDIVSIFFGAQNRESDWAPIMDALNRVLSDHCHTEIHVVHDQKFFHAINIPGSRKNFSPWLDYPEYRRMLRSCDIALLPLEYTKFNEHKSDIGFIEAASEGVAVLASETVYGETIRFQSFDDPDKTGITYRESLMFECWLRTMIEEPKLLQFLATNSYNYVKDHRMLGQHFRDRLAWYRSLVHRKHELDLLLLERVPSLQLRS